MARDRDKVSLNTFNMRVGRVFAPGYGWLHATTCNCCSLAGAHIRQWQKRVSKQVTLRSHRKGK